MTTRTEPAEMKDRMATLTDTIHERAEENPGSAFEDLADYWDWLWANPDQFENGDNTDMWKGSPLLTVFEMGVLFGIDYEQAYPEGRNDEWPVPIDERPSR